ncbi:MAG: thermonuclease family protein [Treponema sp.]|nr:thermonuclease family protein [Treponema sp.]
MKKTIIGTVLLVILATQMFSQQTQSGLTQATVLRVIDGDTIELAGGERVRFIGIDAPETGEPGADEATRFVRELVQGRTVWLEADGADRDRFGRLRRYVWIQQPTNTQDPDQIRRYQLNALLLQHGLATVMIIGSVRNEALFRQLASARAFSPAAPQQATFIGNRNSLVFHTPICASLPAPRNRIYFETRHDAIRSGYRPCQRCGP